MKSYGDDLPNADKVLEELERLTQAVVDANEKSTAKLINVNEESTATVLTVVEQDITQSHNAIMSWIKHSEESHRRFRIKALLGLGLGLAGIISIVVKLYILPLL